MDGFTSACVGPGTTGLVYTCYNVGPLPGQDYTYLYNPSAITDNIGYQITAVISNAGSSVNLWAPISTFSRNDADVSLYFVAANSVLYRTPVSDPLFNATFDTSFLLPGSASTLYQPHDMVAVMGCIDQYQICNPTTSACTSLSGIQTLASEIWGLDLNLAQVVTAQRLSLQSVNSNTYSSVSGTGGEALKASNRVLYLISQGLPSNQWKIEVEGWFETSLAKMQAPAVEYADVTANLNELNASGTVSFVGATGSALSAWQAACSNQKISNTGNYLTFSFFGIVFTCTVGVAIILISCVLKCAVGKLSGSDHYRMLAYVADRNLQLQRMAFTGADYVNWENPDEEIPYTREMYLPRPVLMEGCIKYPQRGANRNVPAEADNAPRRQSPGTPEDENGNNSDEANQHVRQSPERRPPEDEDGDIAGEASQRARHSAERFQEDADGSPARNIAIAASEAVRVSIPETAFHRDAPPQGETPVDDLTTRNTRDIELQPLISRELEGHATVERWRESHDIADSRSTSSAYR